VNWRRSGGKLSRPNLAYSPGFHMEVLKKTAKNISQYIPIVWADILARDLPSTVHDSATFSLNGSLTLWEQRKY
jgi:hypothetical protein